MRKKLHSHRRTGPLRSNRKVLTDGSTTYDFQYQDVGVKLVTESVINSYDQITLKMSIEVSALGDNVGTITDPQYSIRTRSAESVLPFMTVKR